jgi:hypothetical protein
VLLHELALRLLRLLLALHVLQVQEPRPEIGDPTGRVNG